MIKLIRPGLWIVPAVASLALSVGIALAEEAAPAPKPYPLNVCIVTGVELGTMGDPVVLVHEGQEVKFCCAHCQPTFEKDPQKYLKKLEEAPSAPTTQPADNAADHDAHE